MSSQLSLLDVPIFDQQPPKRARQVSRTQIRVMRETGQIAKRQADLVEILERHAADELPPATLVELADWAYRHGLLPRNDANLLKPRATELGPGERRGGRLIKPGGVIEFLPSRKCTVTGRMAHPIRIRGR